MSLVISAPPLQARGDAENLRCRARNDLRQRQAAALVHLVSGRWVVNSTPGCGRAVRS
jgi:hypothetical protein